MCMFPGVFHPCFSLHALGTAWVPPAHFVVPPLQKKSSYTPTLPRHKDAPQVIVPCIYMQKHQCIPTSKRMSDFASCMQVLRLLLPLCVLAALSVFLLGHNSTLHEIATPPVRTAFHPGRQPRSQYFSEQRVVGRPILARGAPRVSALRLVHHSETYDENGSARETRHDVGQYLVRTAFPPPAGL